MKYNGRAASFFFCLLLAVGTVLPLAAGCGGAQSAEPLTWLPNGFEYTRPKEGQSGEHLAYRREVMTFPAGSVYLTAYIGLVSPITSVWQEGGYSMKVFVCAVSGVIAQPRAENMTVLKNVVDGFESYRYTETKVIGRRYRVEFTYHEVFHMPAYLFDEPEGAFFFGFVHDHGMSERITRIDEARWQTIYYKRTSDDVTLSPEKF
ncbi:MAG: hypothetical protein LBM78_00940 [Clostridiales bacterium]|jgi:hypothetical protein|nr:hypothetical protein [Clostridiales bacterium]